MKTKTPILIRAESLKKSSRSDSCSEKLTRLTPGLRTDLRAAKNSRRHPESPADLKTKIKKLKARLGEAEATLNAIRSGEVDALVVAGPEGDQVFTLKGAEMPYRILVEEMNQGALMIIPDGTILYANTRFAGLSKTPLEQVIGSSWLPFFDRDKHPQLAACCKNPGSSGSIEELSLRTADGTSCPVQLSWHTMNASGVAGCSVILTDLTERKQTEQAQRKISEELLEKNDALQAFSHSISHDMRAPLRTMQGFAHVLLKDHGAGLEPEARSYLARIESSAVRLDRLIIDVLAYSQLSSQHNELAAFDLDEVVRETIRTYPNLREADIKIVPSSFQVRGHAVALGQGLANLLGNALKYVAKGVVPQVKVWTESAAGRVRLWVQDNGLGISGEDQGKIFDTFVRLHRNDEYEGTGLGLSLVKKAVEKMGGRVGVESELGQGSRFWIELESA